MFKIFYKQWWGGAVIVLLQIEKLSTTYIGVVIENILICSNCKDCFNCKGLKKIEQECKDAYLSSQRIYPSCQFTKWKIFFFTHGDNDDLNFRLEIHDTEKMKKQKKLNNLWLNQEILGSGLPMFLLVDFLMIL